MNFFEGLLEAFQNLWRVIDGQNNIKHVRFEVVTAMTVEYCLLEYDAM
jgi:hypothetical protein